MRLAGGLGNQLFQFSAARELATYRSERNVTVDSRGLSNASVQRSCALASLGLKFEQVDSKTEIDEDSFLGKFNPQSSVERRFLMSNLSELAFASDWKLVSERRFTHSNQLSLARTSKKNLYLTGYWQSAKYFSTTFESTKQEIWNYWSRSELSRATRNLFETLQSDSNPTCLNIRRGDFLSNPKSALFHGVTPYSYYRAALERLGKTGRVFVFSDDVEWAKQAFSDGQFVVVGHEHSGQDFSTYLMLMASCKNHVIPNSTFGWWAAMLSDRGGRKIAPTNWFVNPKISTEDLLERHEWHLI